MKHLLPFILFFLAVNPVFAKDLVDPDLVYSQNQLALKIFQKAEPQSKEANKIFAPLGTATLLRFFYQGARGPAQQEMAAVLGVEGLEPEVVANRNAGLWMLSKNSDKEEVEYFAPMSFLGAQDTAVLEDFARKAAFFKITPKSYDLKHPYMPYTINDWIKNNTAKKIQDATRYFDPSSPLALFEAFYFKGKWGDHFRTEKKPLPFTAADGSQNPVDFMTADGNFGYYREDSFEAVSLPFSTGRYGLYVFLPAKNSDLNALLSGLTAGGLESSLKGFLERPGKVTIPKFTVQSGWDLRSVLKSLGMEKAFTEGADFRLIFTSLTGRTFLGSFEQQAVFVADEESVPSRGPVPQDIDVSPRHERFSLTAGRPFFFLVRDNKTQVWLALGTVTRLE
jgi:serine protease inhibitor